jgi:subtilase-type serine protease
MEFALSDRTTFATAFGHSNGEQSFSGGRADVTTNQGAVYGSHRLGNGFYVGGQASFATSRIESNLLDQGQGVSGNANTSALGLTSEIEAGRNFDFGGIQVTPHASFGYSSYDARGFRNGSGDLAMAVDKISRRGFEAKAGLKITGSTKLGRTSGWSLQPELKADYVRRLSGNDTNLQVRFLTAEAISLNLPIALQDASYGELKGGFRLTNGVLEFGAVVETRIGGGQLYRDDRAALNMVVRF